MNAHQRWIGKRSEHAPTLLGPVFARTEEGAKNEFRRLYGVRVARCWRENDGIPKE